MPQQVKLTGNEHDAGNHLSMSPFTRYASVFRNLFSLDIGEVTFMDGGSVDEEGMFHVTIDPAASESFYDLYVVSAFLQEHKTVCKKPGEPPGGRLE